MSKESLLDSIQGIVLPKESNCYTSCYCEENVWKLCAKVKLNNGALVNKCYAVFISNPNQTVALWNQKAGSNHGGLVVWDYHVIFLVTCPGEGCMVYDLDSSLSFPSSFETYVEETFCLSGDINNQFSSYFRIVNAVDYLAEFSSDRRHMKKPDKSWISPPPSWPIIQTKECEFNLDRFMDMKSIPEGDVLSLPGFIDKINSLPN